MNKEINDTLIRFWDKALTIQEEDSNIPDYKELAPSKELYEALKELSKKDNILDYGAGYGWASIILLKEGAKNVLACDMTNNILNTISYYANLYNVNDKLKKELIDENFFNRKDQFDGIFCSNVLDVIPLETSIDIIKGFYKLAKKDSLIIIGMNYYFNPVNAKGKDLEFKENKYLFMNGILRLTSLKDEEWINIFKEYFEVKELKYFAWPGEEIPRRRLFILKKK